MKAKSKFNAYNLKLQPCTILSLVCCIFWENHFNQAAFIFHQNPSLRKTKRKSFGADAEEEGENQGVSVHLSVCLSAYRLFCLSVCRSVGLAICLCVCCLFLPSCLSAGRSVGLSVCLCISVSLSVCLAFYIEQKVISEAFAFFNLLFVFSKLEQFF